MSGYRDLGTTGQQKITEQLYKQLFGYPGGKYLQPFSAEIPGTSRINVFQNQLFSQEIPSTAPSVSENDVSFNLNNNYSNTIPSLSKRYVSTTDPHIVYYKNIVLSSNELTQNQIYWFAGANRVYNSNDRSTQLKNNLLTQGIPPNYSPDGSYNATIYISNSEDDEGVAYTIGNAQYPWVYNPNSGIVQFLGNSEFTGSGIPSNNYPNASQIVRFTFWRYEGKIGNDDITATRISAGSITGTTGFIGGVTFNNNTVTATTISASGITGASGFIGGITLDNNTVTATRISASGITGATGFIGGVTLNNNTVTATTINASGITGATGFIGGVTLDNNNITATVGTFNTGVTAGAITSGAITASGSNSIGGVTLNNGTITATVGTFNTGVTAGAITSGAITASGSNSIGGVTLNNNNITATVGTFTGVTAGAITSGAINATSGATFGSDNNYVSILNGNITATKTISSGAITADSSIKCVKNFNGFDTAVNLQVGARNDDGYTGCEIRMLNYRGQHFNISNSESKFRISNVSATEQQDFLSKGSTYVLTINGNNNNVGIGTDDPTSKLHVSGSINATSGATFGSSNKYVSILNGNINAVGATDSDSGNISIIPCATSGYSNVIVQPGDAIIVGAGSSQGKVATVLTTWGATASGIRVGSTALQLGWGGIGATPTHALTFSKDGTVFNNGLTVWGKTDITGTATIGTGNTNVTISSGAITTTNGGSNSIGGVIFSGGAITATGSNSIGGVTLNNGAITATSSNAHKIGSVTITGGEITEVTSITASATITADSFNATSDYRIKENVEPIETNKYNVDKLKPVVYTLKSSNQTGIGFIAHEIQEHYPFLVSGTKDGPETQSVNYIGLIAVLTKEVQQLKQENISLKQRLEKIEFELGL